MHHTRGLLEHVLVPVAHEDNARKTAEALAPYEPAHVTVLHAVEKRKHYPDKTPVEQSEALAAASFAAVREVFPDADSRIAYATDTVPAIFEAADAVDATAVVYRSRGGGRLTHLLSGDLSLKLATRASCPVIALPRIESRG